MWTGAHELGGFGGGASGRIDRSQFGTDAIALWLDATEHKRQLPDALTLTGLSVNRAA